MIRILTASALVALGTGAGAEVLDFTELGADPIFLTQASIAGADLTSFGDGLSPGVVIGNSICAIAFAASGCANDLAIDFTDDVAFVSFEAFGFQAGDAVEALAFDPAGLLVGSVAITGDGLYDLGGFGTLGSLLFDDASTVFGVAIGNVAYEVAASVPLPATLPLLLGAIGGLLAWRGRPLTAAARDARRSPGARSA